MKDRTIVVGDIHGCYDELIELLEKVELREEDRVVSVGDLISKGPKSREVLELFMTDPRFTSVIGNHDLQLRRRWNGEDVELKSSQKETHKELKGEKRLASFFNRMPTIDPVLPGGACGPGSNVELTADHGDLTRIRTLGPDREFRKARRGITLTTATRSCIRHWPAPCHDAKKAID